MVLFQSKREPFQRKKRQFPCDGFGTGEIPHTERKGRRSETAIDRFINAEAAAAMSACSSPCFHYLVDKHIERRGHVCSLINKHCRDATAVRQTDELSGEHDRVDNEKLTQVARTVDQTPRSEVTEDMAAPIRANNSMSGLSAAVE